MIISTLYQSPVNMQNAKMIKKKNMYALVYSFPLHSHASYLRAVVGKVSLFLGIKMLCICS